MSRRPRAEQQFGSDSFLDVVANVVGILIILIVLAGLKMSQAPVLLSIAAQTESQPEDEDDEPIWPSFAAESPTPQTLVAPHDASQLPPEPLAPTPPPSPDPAEPPADLVELADQLTEQIDALAQAEDRANRRLAAVKEQSEALAEAVTRRRGQWAALQGESLKLREKISATEADVEQLRAVHAQLQSRMKELAAREAPTVSLEHRITPLGRMVQGPEKHYRCHQNQISEIPLEELIEKVRGQLGRKKDFLLNVSKHEGRAGPIRGYYLNYIVEREHAGVLDDLRFGGGVMRISVTRWEVRPDVDLASETAAQAVLPTSKFYQSLVSSDSNTAMTFWVYPDSFDVYQQVKSLCHDQGFLVAARPLPSGVPIAGSPNGSRSSGQ